MTIVNIIFFYSFQSTADEMVLIKKYGFGLERDIKGRPLIYPIENYDDKLNEAKASYEAFILVKDVEVKNAQGQTERVRNSVSRYWATGINVSQVDPDSLRYNNISSASAAFDLTAGPLTFVVAGNAGSPYGNRVAALTNNLGAGTLATVDQALGSNNGTVTPDTQASGLSTTSSPTGILSGADFFNDPQGSVVNQKVVIDRILF